MSRLIEIVHGAHRPAGAHRLASRFESAAAVRTASCSGRAGTHPRPNALPLCGRTAGEPHFLSARARRLDLAESNRRGSTTERQPDVPDDAPAGATPGLTLHGAHNSGDNSDHPSLYLDSTSLQAYSQLWDRLASVLDLSQPRAVCFTSARAGVAKTCVAMNLSFVAALVPERRVLVIDADLNSPQAAERLGVHSPCGLSEVLAEGVHPADAIRNAAPNGYDLLSAGRMSPQASDLLGSRRMCVLLRELKHSYDLIVVNGPQITEHSINQFRVGLDAVYLVVQMLCTGRKEVDRALKRSQEGGITVDGCVLAYTGRHVPHSIHAYLDSFGENAFAPTAADESSVAATETSDAKFTANQPPAGHGIADDEVPATDVNDNAYDFLADVLSLVGEPKEQSEYVATEPEQVEPDSSLAGLSAATSDVAHTDDPGVNLSLFECADTLLPNAESTQTADKLHAETLRRLETLQPFDQEVDSPRADCQEPIGAPPLDTELEASSGGSNDPALATTPACSGASTDPTDRVAADGFATETSLIRIPRIARRLLQSRVADVEAAAARAAVRDPWAADLLAFSGLLLAVAGILYVAPDVLLWF